MMDITITINNAEVTASVEPRTTLADFLRDQRRMTSIHLGCEHGVCGACTLLLNGEAVSSCSVLVGQANGRSVLTIEGVGTPDAMHPIQTAFVDNFGLQCGYCTPGMILLTKALLNENPEPTRDEIVRYMGGNICRCTGYAGILASVEAAAAALRSR